MNIPVKNVAGDLATRPFRIAVLNTHPIQYFAPLYAYLNRTADFKITALYLSDISIRGAHDVDFGRDVKWDLDLLSGYESVFVGRTANKRNVAGFWSLIAPELWKELRSGRYDALWLHGHGYAANILALLTAKTVGLPILMRGETHLDLPCVGAKAALRRPVLGMLYGMCDGLLAIGSANARFYRAMGVPERKLHLVPYSVDNARFVAASHLSEQERAEVRLRYGIPGDRPAILYAAKFTSRKRPADLLQAALRLKSADKPFSIVMVGSGELEQELRDFCKRESLEDVIFPGFVNQSELPRLYGACDVFVLPSENEPWGLAVNEAMCARLPVVVSKEVGCAADLVENGVTGYTPKAGDIDELSAALLHLISDPMARSRMGREALERISCWGYRECLQGLRLALAELKGQPSAVRVGL
jgi:glycosyltransferase involved in cell wall biosynthesis